MKREEEIAQEAMECYNTQNEITLFEHGAHLAEEHPKSPWRALVDELPPVKQRVLFLDTNGKPHLGYSNIDGKSATVGAESSNEEVTLRYWMPIPELPKL